MIEPTITAEDLTLYALDLLEGEERARVEQVLRQSTAAREELAQVRGDLALFALGAEQHTPPALTRQRLLKQVARERRALPIAVAIPERSAAPGVQGFAADPVGAQPLEREAAQARSGELKFAAQTAMEPAGPAQALNRAGTTPERTIGTPQAQVQPAGTTLTGPQDFGRGAAAEAAGAVLPAAIDGKEVERQTFAPDPRTFTRDAGAPATTASAHSVTMFEQHFAKSATGREPEVGADAEGYPGQSHTRAAEALLAVEDRFVPSAKAAEESFALRSYRDQEPAEPRQGALSRWFAWSGWAVAAAIAVAAAVALRDDFHLREVVSQQQSALVASQASAARAETVMQTLQSPAAQHFQLARTDATPTPGGRVTYLPERGTLVFQGSNLETLQPYKTYELWLIPAGEGRQPVPAGTFKPDGRGFATVVLPPLQKGLIAANFGVTIEDEGGSTTPTLPILLVGQQS